MFKNLFGFLVASVVTVFVGLLGIRFLSKFLGRL